MQNSEWGIQEMIKKANNFTIRIPHSDIINPHSEFRNGRDGRLFGLFLQRYLYRGKSDKDGTERAADKGGDVCEGEREDYE